MSVQPPGSTACPSGERKTTQGIQAISHWLHRQTRGILSPTCGHRQVVRHQLPKLTSAGSSPVARSIELRSTVTSRCRAFFYRGQGTRTREGATVKQTRSVCRERARAPGGARSRCGFAKRIRGCPVARSIELRSTVTQRCRAFFFGVQRYNGAVTTNVPIAKKEPL